MVSKVALLQPTQLELTATSSHHIYLGTGWLCKTRGLTCRLKCGTLRPEIDNINKITLEVRKSAVVRALFNTVNPLHPLALMLQSTVNAKMIKIFWFYYMVELLERFATQ